jgi:protein-S-isoprenylcysteine O-methyltransferase Ste14
MPSSQPDQTNGLRKRALIGTIQFLFLLALMLFVPAWSLRFWQGWLYWIICAVSVIAITLHFLRSDPALIERRLTSGPVAEKQTSQKVIQAIMAPLFFALLVVPGFDHRLQWSTVPIAVVLAANALCILAWVIFFEVFRANSFAAGTIRVEAEQCVISTGPYRFVRHPMYAAGVLLFVATPLALGSIRALIVTIPLVAGIVARLVNEERYLSMNLAGYEEYRGKVRYRLMPLVW